MLLLRHCTAVDPVAGSVVDFTLAHPGEGGKKTRHYLLRAGSEEERQTWLVELEALWQGPPAKLADAAGASGGLVDAATDGPSAGGVGMGPGLEGGGRERGRFMKMRLSDGGAVANNPAFLALQEAARLWGAPGGSLHAFVTEQLGIVISIGSAEAAMRKHREVAETGVLDTLGMTMKLTWEVFCHQVCRTHGAAGTLH